MTFSVPVFALLFAVAFIALVVWLLTRLSFKAWLALGITIFVVVPVLALGLGILLPVYSRSRAESYVSTYVSPEMPVQPQLATSITPEIVIDNQDSQWTNTSPGGAAWTVGSLPTTPKIGSDYLVVPGIVGWNQAEATHACRWIPTIRESGTYDVYAFYQRGFNRSQDARYRIVYSGGEHYSVQNQYSSTPNQAGWFLIGENLPFEAGESGYVELTNNSTSTALISADAIGLVRRSDELPAELPPLALDAPSSLPALDPPLALNPKSGLSTGLRPKDSLTARAQSATRAGKASAVSAGVGWDANVDRGFLADQYPSDRGAAAGLTHHLIRLYKDHRADFGAPATVNVYGSAPARVLAAVAASARAEWPQAVCQVGSVRPSAEQAPSSQPTASELALEVRTTAVRTRTVNNVQTSGGSLQLKLQSPAANLSAVAEWQDKPWLDDFAAFRVAQGQRRAGNLIVGYSGNLAATAAEAEQAAIRSAAEAKLAELGKRLTRYSLPNISVVECDIEASVRDRFTQRLQRPYGDVYRSAVLAEVSSDAIVQRQVESWAGTGVRLIGLLVLTLMVYLFLNAATRGYYTWSLRVLVMLMVLAGVAMIAVVA